MDNVEKIQEKLNAITFKGCEHVLVGDVLHFPIMYMNKIKHNTPLIILLRRTKWILSIFKRLLICKYKYKRHNTSDSLFLFSSSYGYRNDLKKSFLGVLNLVPCCNAAVYDIRSNQFSVWKLKYIKLVKEWNTEIKKANLCSNNYDRFYLLLNLIKVFCDFKDAEHIFGEDFPGITTLVTFCDVHAADSFFTQKFNAMNRKTVDLMHGSIAVTKNSWSVFGIKSKYFIADSLYTRDLLKNNGYKGKVFVCGYPYNIDAVIKAKVPVNEKIIGVVLSGKGLHAENLVLCKSLLFLKNKGYKIFAKLHPTETKGDYRKEFLELFTVIYETEITSSEFLNRISAAVISSSTVVYEAIDHKIPFVLYADSTDFYRVYGMPVEITADVKMMEVKVNRMLDGKFNKVYESLSDYYTAGSNVKDNYIQTFKKLGIH